MCLQASDGGFPMIGFIISNPYVLNSGKHQMRYTLNEADLTVCRPISL